MIYYYFFIEILPPQIVSYNIYFNQMLFNIIMLILFHSYIHEVFYVDQSISRIIKVNNKSHKTFLECKTNVKLFDGVIKTNIEKKYQDWIYDIK